MLRANDSWPVKTWLVMYLLMMLPSIVNSPPRHPGSFSTAAASPVPLAAINFSP